MNKRKRGKQLKQSFAVHWNSAIHGLRERQGTCKHKKLQTHNGETEEGGDGAAENSSKRGRRVSKGHEVNM